MLRLRRADGKPGDVFVLGSGTIGGQITRHLRRIGMSVVDDPAISWTEGSLRRRQLAEAFGQVEPGSPVDLVWAAGTAGFAADEQQAAAELDAYHDVVFAFGDFRSVLDPRPPGLHVVSSAGGLFEGQHVSDPAMPPTPSRPYGRLKLEEERRAEALGDRLSVSIYRPSSVYTRPAIGRRPGLIGALLQNGLTRSPTAIVGALDTLRDYVHASDVGRFIARAVTDSHREPGVHRSFLVNGEPASILRVINIVERIMRRRLLLQIRDAWNAADITFATSVRAAGFQPMGVAEGAAVTFVTLEQPGLANE